MDEVKYLKPTDLKLVNVKPQRPFRLGNANFTGFVRNILLSVESIRAALASKAFVVEVLADKKEVPLGSDNYNTVNGPTNIPEDAVEFVSHEVMPVIEHVKLDGTVEVFNKPEEKVKISKHIDLEAEKKAKEAEAAKKAAEEAERKAKEEAEAKARAEKEAREAADRKLREEAARKAIERGKGGKAEANFTISAVASVEKQEAAPAEEKKEEHAAEVKDLTGNNQQEGKKKFDSNNKKK